MGSFNYVDLSVVLKAAKDVDDSGQVCEVEVVGVGVEGAGGADIEILIWWVAVLGLHRIRADYS